MTTDPWVVHTKGQAKQCPFEITVLRQSNQLGIHSYGWFNESKLLITHSGGPCPWTLNQWVWDEQLKLAQRYADHLNQLDS